MYLFPFMSYLLKLYFSCCHAHNTFCLPHWDVPELCFLLSNRIPLRDAEPSLHMVSGLRHIGCEWERPCWFTLLPSIAPLQWKWGRAGCQGCSGYMEGRQAEHWSGPRSYRNRLDSLMFGVRRHGSSSVTLSRSLCGTCSVFFLQDKLQQSRAASPTGAKWVYCHERSAEPEPDDSAQTCSRFSQRCSEMKEEPRDETGSTRSAANIQKKIFKRHTQDSSQKKKYIFLKRNLNQMFAQFFNFFHLNHNKWSSITF